MTEFEYDCRQRRNLASQARHRKNGSKSKKCSLPSDRLTNKQWKERCGPIMQYDLSVPMKWAEFKKMPLDVQEQYLVKLQQEYGATSCDFAELFGCKPLTVRRHAESHNMVVQFKRGGTRNPEQKKCWQAFLSGSANRADESVQELNTMPAEAQQTETSRPCMRMNQFSLRFE